MFRKKNKLELKMWNLVLEENIDCKAYINSGCISCKKNTKASKINRNKEG